LSFVANDLSGFATDLGYEGPPYGWDPERRRRLRATLDAVMFKIYGVDIDDAAYVLDSFPIVKRNDERRFGEYLTKRMILDILAEDRPIVDHTQAAGDRTRTSNAATSQG
jgi:hypothetical protein